MTKHPDIDSTVDCDPPGSSNPVIEQTGLLPAVGFGIGCAGALAIGLVIWTAIVGGKAYGERAATDLAMPIGSLWLLLFAGVAASTWRGNRAIALGFAIIWLIVGVTFNGLVAGAFSRSLSHPLDADPVIALTSPLDAVVLLGGYARNNRFGVPELGGDGQRFLLAAQLWHAGKTKTLISTGTGHLGLGDPSKIGRELLVSVGVPEEVIFEIPGENTAAEMRGLRVFLNSPPTAWLQAASPQSGSLDGGTESPRAHTVGLVTSVMHMPRALRLAKTQELQFIAIPCCLSGRDLQEFNPKDLIPSASAGNSFAAAFKEWLAAFVGR